MKKLFSLFLTMLALTFITPAQAITVHVSGTVLRDSTNAPVNNHEVLIQADSNSNGFTFYASRFTNPNGFYDCTIQNVPSSGSPITFTVRTKNCDSTWIVKDFIGTVTYDTVNFLICNGNSGCVAAFGYQVDTAFSYHEVHFFDSSTTTGYIESWHWDFGDGTTQDVLFPDNPNVSHVYTGNDLTYTVCLSIGTSNGCSSTVCHYVTIGNNSGCQAYYTYYTDSTNSALLHFMDESSPLNEVTSRLWNFGDPASGMNNIATTFDPWHTFTLAGTYDVCLSITTSTGCSSTYCDSITVGSNSVNCENWITYTNSGLTYNFEGHTHSPYPTSYHWSFGDPQSGSNNTSTLQNPVHVFSGSGNYTLELNTLDSTGCAWTRHETISVSATCDVNGYAFIGDSLFVDHGLAELIKVENGSDSVVASQQFGDSIGMYWFGGVYPGHYYIRITLLPTSVYYGLYVPTYYVSAADWGDAVLIELGQPENPYNIHMHHANGLTSGDGNINGTINQSGKYNMSGSPASDVEVMLMDATGNVLAYTMTNSTGEFSFSDIALGTYKVYPEMILKTTTPTTVTLDATHTGANVVFSIEGSNISGINDGLKQAEFTVSDVYPNPVSDVANATIHSPQPVTITVAIYSITGEYVKQSQFLLHTGANKITIPVSDLKKGLYYVKVEKPDGGVLVKKFVIGK
jgi:PKD repeat protein